MAQIRKKTEVLLLPKLIVYCLKLSDAVAMPVLLLLDGREESDPVWHFQTASYRRNLSKWQFFVFP